MIPRIIHYCWFGERPIPPKMQECVDSWTQYCFGWEIICWTEKNALPYIEKNHYALQAFRAKRWAFVADYVRLKVLYEYGGIYLDTDVRVLKDLTPLLATGSFIGFEKENVLGSAVMGARMTSPWIASLLTIYEKIKMLGDDETYDETPNVERITFHAISEWGLIPDNTRQRLYNEVEIYPKDFFYPKSFVNGSLYITDNTYTIHLFEGSWLSAQKRFRHYVYCTLCRTVGEPFAQQMKSWIKRNLI